VRGSGEALLGIINDSLDFSKLDAGQVRFERLDFSLRECLDQVIDLVRERASRAALPIAVWVDPELPDLVRGDPGRLRQVLLNLVGNAVKFTERGEVAIELSRDGEYTRFEVHDTGIGIDADSLEDVFQPFSQADPSMTRRFGGTGLGLAISKQLVEAFGGSLEVDSEPGRGSRFCFSIPLAPTERPEEAISHRRSLRHRSALLVCADPSARRGLSALLAHLAVVHRAEASWPSEGRAGVDLVIGDFGVPDSKHVDVRVGPGDREPTKLHDLPHLAYPVSFTRLRRAMKRALGHDEFDSGVLPAVRAAEDLPRRVLVVEDSVVNQLVAQELLSHMGVRSDVVANGAEAVEAVVRLNYDLVLMDISMPVMDGYEAAAEIRKQGREDLPIIAMTANAMPEDVARCRAVGMQAHLSKPVTLEKLRETLARHFPKEPAAAMPTRPPAVLPSETEEPTKENPR
jgi:CheY-like chemotaxis protein